MVVVPTSKALSAVGVEMAGQLETLVIDRQGLFLSALGSILAAPPLSARVVTSSRSDVGLELVRTTSIDLVFCELRAEPIAGIEFVSALAEKHPTVPVILLGDRDDDGDLTVALGTSAAGLFTKDAGLEEFIAGVQAVLSGHRAIGSSLMGLLLNRLTQQGSLGPKRPGAQLSPTEREILAMIGHAQSIPTIAATRGISHKTVRNHLAKIYRKLELHGRTEAMLWAARSGLTG